MEQSSATPITTPAPNGRIGKNYRSGIIAAILLIGVFVGGVAVGSVRGSGAISPALKCEDRLVNRGVKGAISGQDVDFNEYWNVWQMLKQKHVSKKATDLDLFYGSLAGMVNSLGDPYSVFFDPKFASQFASELSGTFEGIGAELGVKNGQPTVIAPLPGTPAEKAGLMAGDKILTIDGVDTLNMALEDAVSRIRGEKGTTVKLLIGRKDSSENKELSIVRGTIYVESVKWRLEKKGSRRVGIITISRFNEDTTAKFREAVQALLLEAPDGVILDLRNNPGGFLDSAVDVAGEWVFHDTIVKEKMADGEIIENKSSGIARLADLPTIVLVNRGSASASEIVAGALQDHVKARIIGETTFGKGSVQDYTEFPDGSALKLTVALWLTPKDRVIDKDGIEPDDIVVLTTEDYENDRDPQLDRAFETLFAPSAAASAPVPAKSDLSDPTPAAR
ncbi:MAG: S41 family peptidase [Patescibacteria group bacterium]